MEKKNLISAVILTMVLIAAFSCFGYRPTEKPTGNGYGTKYKGDSSLIIPGGGELPANTIIEQGPSQERTEETTGKNHTHIKETVCEFYPQIQTETRMEELNNMSEMVIAFWHGVAAVLIGETSALLVALAWVKIKGGKNGTE